MLPAIRVSSPSSLEAAPLPARIGIDLVRIDAIERSLADFGLRFARRLFADGELRASTVAGRLDARALAARFAAKEAVIKAFDLSEAGVGWGQIEVVDAASGDPAAACVRLHGRAAESAARSGSYEIAVSLSESEGHACAIVVALPVAPAVAQRAGEPGDPRRGASPVTRRGGACAADGRPAAGRERADSHNDNDSEREPNP